MHPAILKSWRAAPWLLGVAAVLFLLIPLRAGDLAGYDDALYASQARRMVERGGWLTPMVGGNVAAEHPPLFVWAIAASLSVFGVADWAAKLPAALAGLGLLACTYLIAARLFDRRTAVLSAAVLLGTPPLLKMAGHAMTDVPFAFLFTASMGAMLATRDQPRFAVLAGVCVGLAQLTRAWLGSTLLLPYLLLGLETLWRDRRVPAWTWWAGLLLAIGLPGTWFACGLALHGDQFVRGHLSFLHIVSQGRPAIHSAPGGYVLLFAKQYWPWLPLLAMGLWAGVREAWRGHWPMRLLLGWFALVMAPLLVLDSKALRYVFPAFPALSMLVAMQIERLLGERRVQQAGAAMCLILVAIGAVVAVLAPHRLRAEEMRAVAPVVARDVPADRRIGLFDGSAPRFDLANQLSWYSGRQVHVVRGEAELRGAVEERRDVVLMDAASWARLGLRAAGVRVGRFVLIHPQLAGED